MASSSLSFKHELAVTGTLSPWITDESFVNCVGSLPLKKRLPSKAIRVYTSHHERTPLQVSVKVPMVNLQLQLQSYPLLSKRDCLTTKMFHANNLLKTDPFEDPESNQRQEKEKANKNAKEIKKKLQAESRTLSRRLKRRYEEIQRKIKSKKLVIETAPEAMFFFIAKNSVTATNREKDAMRIRRIDRVRSVKVHSAFS